MKKALLIIVYLMLSTGVFAGGRHQSLELPFYLISTEAYSNQLKTADGLIYNPATKTYTSISANQISYSGIQLMVPLLSKIYDCSQEFQTFRNRYLLQYSKLGGYLYSYLGVSSSVLGALGVDQLMISRNQELELYKALAFSAIVSTFSNIPRTEDNVEIIKNILKPGSDETAKDYVIRILETAQHMTKPSETSIGMIKQTFDKKATKMIADALTPADGEVGAGYSGRLKRFQAFLDNDQIPILKHQMTYATPAYWDIR